MADEGFREIQLNAKQLVFLFMTAAVVLVVTFLCGVLVGRGVRAQKEPVVAAEALAPGAAGAADPTAAALQPVTKTAPQTPPAAPPPQPEEDLSYYSRLEGQSAPPEAAKPAIGGKGSETSPKPAAAQAPAAPKPAGPEAAQNAGPAGEGYYLKVVAYREKAQADVLAARLSRKGFGAYVVPLAGKGTPLYSVRVGKFKARKDADAARRRLEKEEQFKPLITR